MRISTKLIAITLGSAVIVTGLVASLVVQLNQVSTGYTHILQGPVQQAAAARQAQVDFNVQVQDWKNILLRGQNPEDLARYTAQFHAAGSQGEGRGRDAGCRCRRPNRQGVAGRFPGRQ